MATEEEPIGQAVEPGNSWSNTSYPNPSYYNDTNINRAALGADRTELWTGGGDESVEDILNETTVPSQYGKNQVSQSQSGHIQEVDDTFGNQRMLWRHANKKTGIEFRPDGGILVTTPNNKIEITGEDQYVIVEGEGKLIYKGNLDIEVTGDLNISCQNLNTTVRGNKKETIYGSQRTKIQDSLDYKVAGHYSTTVGKSSVSTYLGGYQTNIKGTFSNNVFGTATYNSSAGTFISAETTMALSADNANLLANNVTVAGGTGMIGGQNVTFGGKGASFTEGVTAPTFHGDLDGNAANTYAQSYGEAATSGGGSITDTATPTFSTPTVAEMSDFLEPDNNAAGGINKIIIDQGDFILESIDNSKKNGGVTNKDLDAGVMRSKLRNPSNRSNSTFINRGIETGALCLSFNNPAPAGIGRTSAFEDPKATPNIKSKADGYVPNRKTDVRLLPDQKFDPVNNLPITAKTKLAPGITIGTFLQGEDGGTNFDFVREPSRQLTIANNYYAHAQILKTIKDNNGKFKNYKLVVSEGLYRRHPDETIEAGSIAELKSTGRAVVYKLIDQFGMPATSKTYELAEFWKDTILYDKMILDYDTLDCDSPLDARIIIILPVFGERFEAVYKREIETQFNGTKLTENELVEALSYNPNTQYLQTEHGAGPLKNHHSINQTLNTPDIGYVSGVPNPRMSREKLYSMNGRLDPSSLVLVSPVIKGVTKGAGPMLLTREYADKWEQLKNAAAKDGYRFQVVSAYRSYTYQDLAYKEHKAEDPGYVIAKPGRSRHGWGMAVDVALITSDPGRSITVRGITGPSDPAWRWLKSYGAIYGFRQADRLQYNDPVHWSFDGS